MALHTAGPLVGVNTEMLNLYSLCFFLGGGEGACHTASEILVP